MRLVMPLFCAAAFAVAALLIILNTLAMLGRLVP
jgi:hypothetical protein